MKAGALALVALLAVQSARLAWAVVEPIGPVGAAPASGLPAQHTGAADFAMLDRFDPFFRTAAGAAPATAAPAVGGLKLFGVRSGRGGSAIIAGPDGRQAAFRIGEDVAPGVTLAGVAADHVVLVASGRRTSLFFAAPGSAGPIATPAAYAPPAPPPAPPIIPTAAAAAAAQAGMQPGDVLLTVNGKPVAEAGQAEAVARELASGGDAVLQFERGGQVRSTTLRTANP